MCAGVLVYYVCIRVLCVCTSYVWVYMFVYVLHVGGLPAIRSRWFVDRRKKHGYFAPRTQVVHFAARTRGYAFAVWRLGGCYVSGRTHTNRMCVCVCACVCVCVC